MSTSSSYRPHQKATTVAPMFHIMFEPCMKCMGPLIAFYTRMRWMLAHPLEIRVIPRMVPVISIPYIRDLYYLTIRDLLFVLPLLLLTFQGVHFSYVKPDLDKSGQLASYAIYLTFLTANKSNNLISLLFGVPFERLISLHQLCSVVAVTLGCFHTYAAYQYGGANQEISGLVPTEDSIHASFGTDPNFVQFLWDGKTNVTGTLLVISMTAMIVLSVLPVRRVAFQLWLYSHIILATTALIVCFLHNVTTVVFVLLWWVLDLSIRYLLMAAFRYHAVSTATLEILCHEGENDRPIVQITLPKPDGFDYLPGQFVQLAIPSISLFQYHPVSISSAPHEDTVTFQIRALGDWTDCLVDLAASGTKQTTVMMEGPYGALSVDLDDPQRYKTVLLVGGGIGNTHCESVGKSLLHDHECHGRPLTHLRYVWTVRQLSMPNDMPPLGGYQPPQPLYAPGTPKTAASRSPDPLMRQPTHATEVDDASNSMHSIPPPPPPPQATVNIDVYCTREDVEDAASVDNGHDDDGGAIRYHLGIRPDLDAILEEMKETALANGESNVAVIGCGPGGMMEGLRDACRKHSTSVVGCGGKVVFFDFHTERFEF